MPVLVLALALPLSLSTSLLLSFQVFKYELEKARLSCGDPTCALAALGDEPLPSLKNFRNHASQQTASQGPGGPKEPSESENAQQSTSLKSRFLVPAFLCF